MQVDKKRYEALDAWRGLSACILVFFHFFNLIKSHFNQLDFIQNSFIFVDFFFVLSGFVIAANYQEKLLNGMPAKDYIFLRLGRLYPLHFTVLSVYILLEVSKFLFSTSTPPFTAPNDLSVLISSFFLTQSLGLHDHLGWNVAAWSISVEFYTYILYAGAVKILGARIWPAALAMIVLVPLIFLMLGKTNIGITYDYGFLRCIYGFSAGILVHHLLKSRKRPVNIGYKSASAMEILIVTATILFIGAFGRDKLSFISPYLFAVLVAIFSQEKGAVSNILRKRPFILIGTLSYSVYLIHPLIETVLFNAAKALERISSYRILEWSNIRGREVEIIKGGLFLGDAVQVSALIITLAVSYITYRLIEAPCNRWVRRYIQKTDHVNVPQGESAAF